MGLIGGDFRRKSGIGGGDLCFFRSSNDGKSLGGGSIGSLDCWTLFFGLMFETCDRGGFCFESWSCSHFGTNILDKTENGSLLLEKKCENFRFYVKSILENLEALKSPFLPFLGL